MQLTQLEQIYKQNKEHYSDNFRLRIHRSLSWLKQAEQTEELDFKFIALWVSFNAAYAQEIDDKLSEKIAFNELIFRICEFDKNQKIYHLIWHTFSGSIRTLLDNPYIFQPFWDFHNNKITEQEWLSNFKQSKKSLQYALSNQDTAKILIILCQRLYTLRNQILHGSSTFNSSVNRSQVKDACAILTTLMPLILNIMIDNPNEIDWGKPFYPVV
ncbi:hypothetical protein F9B74_08260 [Pelistega sp. NLN82]|uniref:Uncharacterized protein n=1 Tax=Pelistega ratti TaxID=2652177 RepID=A0A6L9Y9A9_9BURK|nr:HEPN domain-containing protein [Pelistega ratti]NEN76314.1 hypothetical protein [Pelistega ratti]